MNHSPGARIAAAALLAVGTVVVASGPAAATPAAPSVAPGVLSAMQHDLGLRPEQAASRLGAETQANRLDAIAQRVLGDKYAGGWFDPATGRLVAQTTDAARAATLRASGVDVRTVSHSERQLDGIKNALDSAAGRAAPPSITGWYVDTRSDSVVVTVNRTARDAATEQFLARANGLGANTVREVDVTESVRTLTTIRGGDPYYIDKRARCSIGFAVQGGFVSAGHCGQAGSTATVASGAALGTFQGAHFPGAGDYSWVKAAAGAAPQPVVNNYRGGTMPVRGSTPAAVGASVCRSGSSSGWHCGTIQAKNQTVNYPEGTVSGLTKTNVCAEPGDSGGGWLSGQQAQGVTSGGSGDCKNGGTTYFQPVNQILSAYGLTLLTG